MKLETFFNNFDQFANAPNAIPLMREIVLQLAVRGSLTEQISSESSSQQRDLATASGLRRGRMSQSEAEEIPFPIPENWDWVAVGDSMELINGRAFRSEEWSAEGTPIIRIQNLNNENAPFNCCSADLDPKIHVHDGDLLISWSGTPGTSFGAFIWNRGFAYLNQHIFRCAVVDGVFSKEFLRLAINARLDEMISQSQGGVGLRHITKGKLESIRLPLPPLVEQKRIVAKVDELMALCDRLEEQQQERETRHAALARASLARFAEAPTPANLEFLFHNSYAIPPADLRKSILTLAVQGKLVPQDPHDEPAADSLARNDERRRDTARGDHRADDANQPLLSADDRWDIADTWSWRGLADLVLFVDYRGKTPAKLSSGVRLLTAKNVRKGHINLSPEEFVSESEFQSWMTRGFPKPGDVLFTTEAPMGNAAVIDLTDRFALAQRVICFQSYGAIDPAFLVLHILSDQFQSILDKNGTGVTAKGIKASKLKQLPIAVPPLAEQRRIVAKVNELLELVDVLEIQLATARDTAAHLMEALVHKLLTGPQPKNSPVEAAVVHDAKSKRPNRHFARALLSAEIVHQLHAEPTFGRIKHQKVFHLCESLARIPEVEGQYSRKAAGPFDNKLVYANESELKKQKWYDTVNREKAGHRYVPLEKAGGHARYVEQYWPDQLATIRNLITVIRTWDTDRCEIFSTTYAAWNDLVIWGREATDEAILHEILDRWSPEKRRFPRERWLAAIRWMKEQGYVPTGFGRATTEAE